MFLLDEKTAYSKYSITNNSRFTFWLKLTITYPDFDREIIHNSGICGKSSSARLQRRRRISRLFVYV